MKRMKKTLLLAAVLLTSTLTASATVFINEKAPGVHKKYDSKLGKEVWTNSMGNYLGDVKDSKPMSEIDKDFVADHINKKAPGVHKEYDPERKCMVWKDAVGNFLGRDTNQTEEQYKTFAQMLGEQTVYPSFIMAGLEPDFDPFDPVLTKKNIKNVEKELANMSKEEAEKMGQDALKKKDEAVNYAKSQVSQVEALVNELNAAGGGEYAGQVQEALKAIKSLK